MGLVTLVCRSEIMLPSPLPTRLNEVEQHPAIDTRNMRVQAVRIVCLSCANPSHGYATPQRFSWGDVVAQRGKRHSSLAFKSNYVEYFFIGGWLTCRSLVVSHDVRAVYLLSCMMHHVRPLGGTSLFLQLEVTTRLRQMYVNRDWVQGSTLK